MKGPRVKITADEDSVTVTFSGQEFLFECPGVLTGADLEKVLEVAGFQVEYVWTGKI